MWVNRLGWDGCSHCWGSSLAGWVSATVYDPRFFCTRFAAYSSPPLAPPLAPIDAIHVGQLRERRRNNVAPYYRRYGGTGRLRYVHFHNPSRGTCSWRSIPIAIGCPAVVFRNSSLLLYIDGDGLEALARTQNTRRCCCGCGRCKLCVMWHEEVT